MAVVAEVLERGELAGAGGVAERVGQSAESFYAVYGSIEECAVDALELFIDAFKRRVGRAFNSQPGWRRSLRAAAYETADFMEENPELLRFGITGVLQVKSELARVRREELFVFCAGLIDRGRTEPNALVDDDGSAAAFAVGSIAQLLTHRMQSGVPIEPHAIVPEMMFAVVRLYLGEEAAREELEASSSP